SVRQDDMDAVAALSLSSNAARDSARGTPVERPPGAAAASDPFPSSTRCSVSRNDPNALITSGETGCGLELRRRRSIVESVGMGPFKETPRILSADGSSPLVSTIGP